jgi:hypothetical protein
MSTCVNILNLEPGSRDLKHPIWKTMKPNFLLIKNDEIKKKFKMIQNKKNHN